MFLRKLELNNFRNISKIDFEFNKNINIFIGNNAQGKTNVLESIYFLAITRSHRTHNELNLIKNDALYTKVSGTFFDDSKNTHMLSILLNEKGKKVSVDNIMQKKISNYLSRLNVIMFCPDDLEIIKGTPATRRKFLNIELSQFKKDYVFQLKEYNQVLKQRNEYLKQKNNASNSSFKGSKNAKFDKTYFSILTEKLAIKNIELVKIRYDFINKINNYLKDVFDKIAGFGNLEIKYKSFIHEQDLNKANLKDFIINKYNSMFMNELLQKTTLLGCHKDDFKMYLNDLDVTEFSSQGQQRLSILSLKLAEIEVFVKEKHTKPIILLDDIFSELDEIKKNNIIDYFKEDIQIFITTTDIKDINDELKAKSDIYVVDNGNFNKEE